MTTTIKVVDPDKFKGIEVDTSGLRCNDCNNGMYGNFIATGTLTVYKNRRQIHLSTGEFGVKDYLSDYGFLLVPDYETDNVPEDLRFPFSV